MADRTARFYIGTYTRGDSKGIYLGNLDLNSGALQLSEQTIFTEEPAHLAIHPNGRFLYCVNQTPEFEGKPGGSLAAFAIDPNHGILTLLNRQSTLGRYPCYVGIDSTGRYALATNYDSGNVAVLPILEDGSLGAASGSFAHQGKGLDPNRQTSPHPHSILGRDGFAYVPDLGIDKVMIHRLAEDGSLTAHDVPFVKVSPGSGPRHMVFHQNSEYAYVVNELNSSVTVFRRDRLKGALQEIETISTLPSGHQEPNTGAAIRLHPSGRFLYVSNRGHNSLALFAISQNGKRLQPAGHFSTNGTTPSHFAIDSSGSVLVVANTGSSTVVSFKINKDSGELTATDSVIRVPIPTCIEIVSG